METCAGFNPFRIEMAALTGPPSMWPNEVAFVYHPQTPIPVWLVITATNCGMFPCMF